MSMQQVVRKRLPAQVCLEEATNVASDSVDVSSSDGRGQATIPMEYEVSICVSLL